MARRGSPAPKTRRRVEGGRTRGGRQQPFGWILTVRHIRLPSHSPATPEYRGRGETARLGLAPLVWAAPSKAHRIAATPTGDYVLITDDGGVTWSAQWRRAGGKVQRLSYRQPLAAAADSCEQHRQLLDADARLVAGGFENLTGTEITGEAVTWKRGGRR